MARRVPVRPELVPSPRAFFDSDAAHAALAALLRAEAAGERALLLMGNQGVGKNVCVDQLLHMLRCEREYANPNPTPTPTPTPNPNPNPNPKPNQVRSAPPRRHRRLAHHQAAPRGRA